MRAFIALSLAVVAGNFGARPSEGLQVSQVAPVVRVLEGRASVATVQGLTHLRVGSPEVSLSQGGHVELGLLGSTQLRWPRRLGLTVRGYSSFGIAPERALDANPRVEFLFLGNLDVELRRGSLTLDLPQGWTLVMGRGSVHLKELVDGRLQLVNRAGAAIQIIDRSSSKRRTPKPLVQGQSLVLPTL